MKHDCKRSRIIIPFLALVLCASLCASCGMPAFAPERSAPEEETVIKISEGVDTACEITGYVPYSGAYGDAFLSDGDAVAVISPSSLPTREQVDATVAGLQSWGYVPVEGAHVCDAERTLEDCLSDLVWALEDPEIKAVFCVRGGYGASEVMAVMPEGLIETAGKLIIGYSDITVFHSAWTDAGLPSVHCSMAATFMDLPAACADAEKRLLRGEIPAYRCAGSQYALGGSTEGILIGGNLATFTSVLGTAHDCSKMEKPYILFFEDVEEDLQHIHRYLTILKNEGVLDGASGIVFGEWTDMPVQTGDYGGDSRGGAFTSVADMISREFLADLDVPVAFGFPAGHGEVNYPLLMGEEIRHTVSEDSFTLEPV